MKWLTNWLFEKRRRKPVTSVTAERLEQMLEYARRRNMCGQGYCRDWIGESITIEYEPRHIVPHRNNPVTQTPFDVPRYVGWTYVPTSLKLCLEDGKVVMRASHDGAHPPHMTPLATDPADIQEIERCFEYWYTKFELPMSLQVPTYSPPEFVPSGDAMADISTYLESGRASAFYELFEDDDPMVWIDWREDDSDLVAAFARVLRMDDLSAEFVNEDCDLLIQYRGQDHRVQYPEPGAADRDTTICHLNQLLMPDHEIRFCIATDGNDTLAFLPLPARHWAALEAEFPDQLHPFFEKIGPNSRIFDA
jgi:hypothetical protein